MFANAVFVMNFLARMTPAEMTTWLLDAATLQEAHHFHGNNWPDWVPGAAKFRLHAEIIPVAKKAAENKDREKVKEFEEAIADAILSINLNANYIVMRFHHEKNDSLLHNVGYVLKEKTKKISGHPSLSNIPSVVRLKNGPGTRAVTIRYDRDPAALMHQVQICKGQPAGEESWGEVGFHKGCRVIKDQLDLASWYYFRVRSHGDNETGPWSAPVGIIVI